MIQCRLLGPAELDVDGAPGPAELLWRKHLALLVYLARSPRGVRTRDHLIGVLWPDKEEKAARHSLNEALRIIRRVAGDSALETSAGAIRLMPGSVRLDLEEFESRTAAGRWASACEMIGGEFLEGFSLPDAAGFEDWLAAERRIWKDRAVDALLSCSGDLLRAGNSASALDRADRALALDPYADRAMRAVISALAVQGETARALARFEEFAARLTRDLGVSPDPETRRLAERIGTLRRPRPAPPSTREPSLRRPPLFGREGELGKLLDCWEENQARAVLLVVEGDAGTGKSRLLDELRSRLVLKGVSVPLMRAVESDQSRPHEGLIGLARGGLLESPGVAAAPAAALAALGRRLPDWGDRFRGDCEPDPLPKGFEEIIEAAVFAGPMALMIDDAQWLDPESCLIMAALLRNLRAAPLAVVLSTSSHRARVELDQLRTGIGRDYPGSAVVLGPLDSSAIGELAGWAFPRYDAEARGRLARRVSRDSAGLPFLAVELLDAVAAGLELEDASATWPSPLRTLSETLPADLPDSISAALRIGFRRLSPEAQQVLAAAAVIGGRCTEADLGRATGIPQAPLHIALDELEWERWLEVDGTGYGFVASIAQRVLERDMVTRGQRARILARLG